MELTWSGALYSSSRSPPRAATSTASSAHRSWWPSSGLCPRSTRPWTEAAPDGTSHAIPSDEMSVW